MPKFLSFLTGAWKVSSAGTPVRLTTTETRVTSVIITAESENTGLVVIGDANIVATAELRRGHAMAAGESITIDAARADELGLHGQGSPNMIDLSDLYIDALNSSDAAGWLAYR